MSGHSKWSTIKRQKGKTDAARGRIFTRMGREIMTAAKQGGGDPEMNPRLRTAIAAAKAVNMPSDNIKRAIQKGTGELPGVSYDEIQYEAYGPAGVAILIQTMTDNKNRTVGEIRHLLSKNGGNMGEAGCVAWMFTKQGVIEIDASAAPEDVVMEIALEAGASDVSNDGGAYTVITEPAALEAVKSAFEKKNIAMSRADLDLNAQTTIKLTDKPAEQMLKLMDALEEHEDVQKVYANFDIDDATLERIGGE
ncbi:MAG: YebC/PmpR family DNA-binding transcriptional regulator [Candidatus Zixiibacteriota bacterium]